MQSSLGKTTLQRLCLKPSPTIWVNPRISNVDLLHDLTYASACDFRRSTARVTRYPKLRVQRFCPASLHYGVEEHRVGGATLRVTDVAKTVADCFKFRNKVGLDVAPEALRDSVQDRRTSIDAIRCAAKVCRVAVVMRPYLESLG